MKEPETQIKKKAYRDTYGRYAKEINKSEKQKSNSEKIQSINFGEDALIIATKKYLIVESLITLKVIFKKQGEFWSAVFIPNTSFLAVIEHNGTPESKRSVRILDLEKDQYIALVTLKYQIEQIKASQNCICLGGVNQISVIHFPSLKPICHEMAGSGLKIIFDISFEGLTLAYQNQKIGYVTVHNFSSLSIIKTKRKSQDVIHQKTNKGSLARSSFLDKPKKFIEIKAHNQHINLIKLSPNGLRIATTSKKGTLVRIFLTENGKLWQQLRVGYQLCKILDFCYYQDGNILGCLTQKSIVNIFNLKLQPQQQSMQSEKRGYNIYQQTNEKSIFSFLSFFYRNFDNQRPFAYYQLVKPQEEIKKDQKLENYSQNKQKKQHLKQVKQDEENEKDSELIQIESKQRNQKEEKIENKIEKSKQNSKGERSISVASSTNSKRNKSLMKKFNLIQAKKESYDYISKVYNTSGKIYVGGNNFVYVVKGPYVFMLKYDSFNGGQMYFKKYDKFI